MSTNLRAAPVLESRWDEVDGLRMHAQFGGHGAPVVLVHGYGVSGRYMLPLARILASSCSAFAPDLPGHGRSEALAGAVGICNLADAPVGGLCAVGWDQPAAAGNCTGWQIVSQPALR